MTPTCDTINSFYITNITGLQVLPKIVYGSGQYFVVWLDGRDGAYKVYGARVTTNGTVLEPNGVRIGTEGTIGQDHAVVGYNGIKYFVVWTYQSSPCGLTGRFVNTNGTLGDTVRILPSSGVLYDIDIAYDGSNFLVIWVDGAGRLRAQRLSGSSGTPIGSTYLIADSIAVYYTIKLGWNGYNYLVTYCKVISGISQVMGRFCSTAGEPLGAPFKINNTTNSCYYNTPIYGANGRYLNVWTESRGSSSYDIYGNIDVLVSIAEKENSLIRPTILRSTIVTDFIEVRNKSKIKKMAVYDILGNLIGSSVDGRFDCSNIAAGIYFVVPDDESVATVRVVKIR